jgi:class 3 adenylate cyclase
VVKTIGDAVMATFVNPAQALAAALRIRDAMRDISSELVIKIGIHEGACLAVTLNGRQDYFGQTVNIASRVQGLCQPRSIVTTAQVLGHGATAALLQARHLPALPRQEALRGISRKVEVFEIPQGTEAGAAATAPG